MLSNRARLALTDIRDNIRLAEQFAAGLSVEALKTDRRTFYAVTRCLEIISEAARRLPQSLRNRHPELPWRAIMGAGNVYRHDYDNVAEEIVWRTVQNNLAPLLAAKTYDVVLTNPPFGKNARATGSSVNDGETRPRARELRPPGFLRDQDRRTQRAQFPAAPHDRVGRDRQSRGLAMPEQRSMLRVDDRRDDPALTLLDNFDEACHTLDDFRSAFATSRASRRTIAPTRSASGRSNTQCSGSTICARPAFNLDIFWLKDDTISTIPTYSRRPTRSPPKSSRIWKPRSTASVRSHLAYSRVERACAASAIPPSWRQDRRVLSSPGRKRGDALPHWPGSLLFPCHSD